MPSQTTALKVAKYFIWKANTEEKEITNKKLQKLLYYAQAWNLVFDGKPLFNDKIEAWIHGPAIAVVYDEYKKYGRDPISERVAESDIKDLEKIQILNDVWNVYGKFDAGYLEILTHNELPWQKARENLDTNESSNANISQDIMKQYYSDLLKEIAKKSSGK